LLTERPFIPGLNDEITFNIRYSDLCCLFPGGTAACLPRR
jgi:hypothetical protein